MPRGASRGPDPAGPAMSGLNATQGSLAARVVRDPLFVFAVAGLGLYLVYAGLQAGAGQTIRLPASTRAALISNFEALAGRPATPADVARIERDFINDEVLFREALANDLHLSDSSVRSRLIEEMRMRITGPLPDPTDEQLVNHYSENLDRYRSEPAITFQHVYFSERPANEAALLEQLRAGRPIDGESFDLGREFPQYGRSLLRGMFGQPFTEALWNAPLHTWVGPLESARGWHFVQATERLAPALLPFDAVRQQVEIEYLAAQIASAVDRHVDDKRQRLDVQIER
jgi:PPIC-type PPIASE domain